MQLLLKSNQRGTRPLKHGVSRKTVHTDAPYRFRQLMYVWLLKGFQVPGDVWILGSHLDKCRVGHQAIDLTNSRGGTNGCKYHRRSGPTVSQNNGQGDVIRGMVTGGRTSSMDARRCHGNVVKCVKCPTCLLP